MDTLDATIAAGCGGRKAEFPLLGGGRLRVVDIVDDRYRRAMSNPIAYKRPKPPLRLKSVPRFGEVYWCDFSISNVLPEFDAEHPAIIIRSGQKLSNPHLVVPLTTVDHMGDVYAHELSVNPVPQRTPRRSWAICHHIYTVASERLRPIENPDKFNDPIYPKLSNGDLRAVGILVRKALSRLLEASLAP